MKDNNEIIFNGFDWVLYIGALVIFALMLIVSIVSLVSANLYGFATQFVWVVISGLVIKQKRKKLAQSKMQ